MGLQQVWLSYNQLFNLFFFFLFLCQLTCLNAQLCTQEQNFALLQFKRNFSFNKSASLDCEDYYGITSFPKMKSWKKGSDCCSWDGVDCDGTGQVIGLDLSCSWLQGTIHPNSSLFLSFPHLQKLNLAYNDFFMSRIPPEFTRFTELTHLNLSWSGFSGKVPPGVSFLNKLVSLDLSYNSGLGLEEGGFQLLIQNLSKLRDLDLSGVNISSSVFLNSLLNLTSLRTLGLRGSGLRGEVLPGVFYLNKLVSLDLSGNFDLRLEEGVFELLFQNLSKLRYLNLMDINMSSLVVPKSLLNLTSLRTLLLGGSGLHGEFPSRIFHLPHLRDLAIWGEEGLTGYIPDFINLTYPLQSLILLNTSISGILPDSIANLKSLEELILSYCNFQGSIPTSFWTLPQIRHIQLDSNNFSGILPSSISNLTQITHLGLSFNHFSGVLPSSISNITNLAYLYLFNNNFTGPFFSWDVNLPKLEILDVSNNCLTGPLPSQVIVPPNLFGLSIGQNLINGTIPSWVFELPTLKYLDLSYNQLIGRTLEFQSSWLESIDLSNNYLHGTVPNSTFELQYLTDLILSSNRFSGTIPKSNRFSGYLKLLELQMNNFSGTIPDSFSMRNPLKTINLHGNGFEGPIPKSLVNCTNLEVLDLGRNKFLDKFPRWLGSLPNLRVLILHSNKFHGSILASTRTKFPFPMLRVLDMSNNNFTGPLPTEYFKSFKAMMNVDEVHFYLEYLSSRHASFKWNVYYDSLTMVIKGSTMEMEKILTIFTVIDLSSNKFEGEIPESIGVLNSIRGLNLSHNNLTGAIPKSLGNMTKLEWLDLSSNNLTGEIPQQLTNLTSLGMLNLSHNRLMGPIPRGKQFDTFLNDSYINNSALCGPPLSNTCGDPKATQPPPSTFEEEDSEPVSGFGWEVILPGYGFGLVVGLVMGYLMFSFGKPLWLVMMVEGVGNRNVKRQKSNARRRGGRRN